MLAIKRLWAADSGRFAQGVSDMFRVGELVIKRHPQVLHRALGPDLLQIVNDAYVTNT